MAADKLLSDSEFHNWWQKRGYQYANHAATSTVLICQSWSKHVLNEAHYEPKPLIHLSKSLDETWRNWLDRHEIPFPDVKEKALIKCHYFIRRQDLYAEIDNGQYSKWLYYLPKERSWQSSMHGPGAVRSTYNHLKSKCMSLVAQTEIGQAAFCDAEGDKKGQVREQ